MFNLCIYPLVHGCFVIAGSWNVVMTHDYDDESHVSLSLSRPPGSHHYPPVLTPSTFYLCPRYRPRSYV